MAQSAQLHDPVLKSAGIRHFLAKAPAFEPGRASWIALFDSLEKGDGAGMAVDLQQLELVMKR